MLKNKLVMQKLGWTLLVTILLAILGAMVYMIANTEPVVAPVASQNDTIDTDAVLDDLGIDTELLGLDDGNDIATLDTVRDEAEYGVASRLYEDELYTLEILVASIPPIEGKFYEAWLVNSTSEFISVGALEYDAEEDTYFLTYSSDKDLTSYSKVVITQETSATGFDNKPELHILEGSF